MLREIRKRPETPLRLKLEGLALRKLSDRVALEAYRGMTREEIGLRLALDQSEVAEVVEYGVGRGTLAERDGLVHKQRGELFDAAG